MSILSFHTDNAFILYQAAIVTFNYVRVTTNYIGSHSIHIIILQLEQDRNVFTLPRTEKEINENNSTRSIIYCLPIISR